MANQSRIYKLNILADTKGLTDGLDKAKNQVNSSQSGISAAFDKVKLAAIAATAAAGAYAIKLGVDGVKAAIEDTAAQERLANALRNTVQASDAQIRSVEAQILKLSMATGVADDQLRPAFQRLTIATGDLNKSQTLLTLALDISAATGKSVESVTNALGKAYEGSTTSLTKLGVGLSAAQIETLGLEGAIGQLATTFGGAAATQAETFEGKMQILKVRLDEAKETIGAALLPILDDLVTFVNNYVVPAVEGFANFWQNNFIPYLKTEIIPEMGNLQRALGNVSDALGFTRIKTKEASTEMGIFETVVRNYIPSIISWFTTAANVWATFIDLLRRGIAFIQGDFDTALAQWNNRFDQTKQVTNNVSDATIRAYKEFAFWNNQTRNETIPINDKATQSLDRLRAANDRVTTSSREATAAMKEQFTAAQALDLIRAGFGSVVGVTGGGGGQLPGGESFRSAAELVGQFGGLIPGFNQLPTDPFYGFGKGSTLQGFQKGGTTVNINVTGTVVDPEGAARAIANVIQKSAGRAGNLQLAPALGIE